MSMRISVIGGGAAGFFGAISCILHNPETEVTLLEKSPKLLSKVKVSGGGRCNVTNATFDPATLSKNYPRGEKQLKQAFREFSTKDTVAWFEKRGVSLKTEPDGRVFPVSDDSQTIIDCLVKEARVHGVKILTQFGISTIQKKGNSFILKGKSGVDIKTDLVLVATGGGNNPSSYQWLKDLGHTIVPPVPSLFTFNVPDNRLNGLQGISVPEAIISIPEIKAKQTGPLLITHWGFSGPGILKLSAWEARELAERNYDFQFNINWLPEYNEEELREALYLMKTGSGKNAGNSYSDFKLPKRLWERLLELCRIDPEVKWGQVPKKNLNFLVIELNKGAYRAKGKTTFKEEFVTCGGIDLNEIDFSTMESKVCKGLYFAGEVLNIDGITGGFNFQAAWTTGYIAGKNMAYAMFRK